MVPQGPLSLNLLSLSGSSGSHQSPPSSLPTVLFFWGPFRILPVAITSLSVTETEYDTLLNPVRADVSVNLEVLQPNQLAGDTIGQRGLQLFNGREAGDGGAQFGLCRAIRSQLVAYRSRCRESATERRTDDFQGQPVCKCGHISDDGCGRPDTYCTEEHALFLQRRRAIFTPTPPTSGWI